MKRVQLVWWDDKSQRWKFRAHGAAYDRTDAEGIMARNPSTPYRMLPLKKDTL